MDNFESGDNKSPQRKGPEQARSSRLVTIVLLVVFGAWLFYALANWTFGRTREMPISQLQSILADLKKSGNGVESAVIRQPNELRLTLKNPQDRVKIYVFTLLGERQAMQVGEELSKVEIPYSVTMPNQMLLLLIQFFAPVLLILALFYFIFYRQMRNMGGANGGVLSFGKSRARLASKESTGITFDDVAGIIEAKEEVVEIIEFLKNPGRFQRLGGRIPRGVLLIGAPGTGKTLLAKAIAGEAEVPFYSICGSDFVEMFVGVGASRVRDLFRQAKENAPCIIFLDEIDAVGRRRGHGWGGGHDEREQTLNAILVEMDGFETDNEVILIAATNRPDVLDPALLRPGRFDRAIYIDLPDIRGREEILRVHARKVKMAPDVDMTVLARSTPTFSGAELEAIINEAALTAGVKNKDFVDLDDLEEARDKIRWGREKHSKVMDEEEKRVTAYHEGGHALVTRLLPDAEPLHKVTIIPRGPSLGSTMSLPKKDRYTLTRRRALAMVKVLFAGRYAEELFCKDISSGAADDIKRATDIVRMMIREWGMSDRIGPINFGDSEDKLYGGEVVIAKSYSEATAIEIDSEIKKVIDDCARETRHLLETHADDIHRLAEALLIYESLDADDVENVLAGRPVRRKLPAAKRAADKLSQTEEERLKEGQAKTAGEAIRPRPQEA